MIKNNLRGLAAFNMSVNWLCEVKRGVLKKNYENRLGKIEGENAKFCYFF
jgi:hypothetical protein